MQSAGNEQQILQPRTEDMYYKNIICFSTMQTVTVIKFVTAYSAVVILPFRSTSNARF